MKRVVLVGAIFVVLLIAALSVTLFGGITAAQSADAATDWPMLQHDAAGTGYNPTASGPTSDVGPRWVVYTDGPATNIQPIVANGTVYVGSGKYSGGGRGVLFAIDAATGTVDWRTDLGDSVHTTAVVEGDRVYVIVRDEVSEQTFTDDRFALVAVDATTGEEQWRTPLPGENAEWVDIGSALVLSQNQLFLTISEARGNVQDSGSAVLAFDAASGDQVWRYEVRGQGFSAPVAANGTVYVTATPRSGEGPWSVVALDASDGTGRWETSIDTTYLGVPPLPAGERVYVAGPRLLALAETDGTVVRSYNVTVYSNSRPALADGTLFYITATSERLAALDLDSGDVRWQQLVSGLGSSPSVDAEHVYVGGGTVEAFDRETGERVWNVTVDDRYGVDTTPVVVDDTVYVGPAPFHVYALAEGGTATPGGPIGGFIGWLAANPPLNGLFIGVLAALFTGLLGGLAIYGVIRGLHYSDAPPRILASKLFRRPYDQVTGGQTLAAHIVASIGILLTFSIVGAVIAFLGVLVAITVGGLLSFVSTGAGVLVVLVVLVGFWTVLSYRWLPAYEELLDRELSRVRREWAIVHVLYGIVLFVFPIVYFILFLIVFQPF
ncbi:PQQ-binding-like beta-propeller repeat protein [Halorubrum sp. HHNYT27]|uniref:outer membrane protein assembly factor BamB family protein n=1 Tax=Halorubrum sp. HHNYT27 TaxID=3402275 RepID=UPI003EC0890B